MATTEMLKIQFYDSYNMLKELVRICPDNLWKAENHGLPIWNQIIHTICGSFFWLREDYEKHFSWKLPLPERLRDKIINDDWCVDSDDFMTKAEINECFECLDKRLESFWSKITDEMLNSKTWADNEFTYLSVIAAQIRHIMCHVGMCNAALIENGFDEAEWIAFGEN